MIPITVPSWSKPDELEYTLPPTKKKRTKKSLAQKKIG